MTDMSDHFANFIVLHWKNKNRAVDRPMVRIFSDKNKATFQTLLSTINWENELSDKGDVHTEKFLAIFLLIIRIFYFDNMDVIF